ncbi:MAG: DUF424 family protein [Candidatus Woesearchaeota archaeon]|nr:DUF424 family protein [Candidatus Woesearchaeota archaeon]
MKFILKVHESNDFKVLAICDPNILGKKFEDKKIQLDLSSDFYKGKEVDKDELLSEVKKRPCHLNIAGKDSINLFLRQNIINKEKIIWVKGVPFAMVIIEY